MGAEEAKRTGELPILGLLADVCRIYARHWKVLVPLALVVLIPQGASELFALGIDLDGNVDFEKGALAVATGAAIVATNLAGEALYAALITTLVVAWSHGMERPPLGRTLRELPLLRLIAADLLLVLGTVLGLLLLILPGILFAAYTVSTTVIIELEDASIRQAFKRSIDLVRGSLLRVLVITSIVILGTEAFTLAANEIGHQSAIDGALHLAVETVLEPIQGLAIVLITLGLIALKGEPAPQLGTERPRQ